MSSKTAIEPIASVLTLLEHLSTQVVHETYAPFLRLPVLHAVRVSIAWASLTRTRDRGGVGVLQDMFGYLVLAWGGSTLAALLQSTPPPWLISPTVWIIYPSIYLLFIFTGISSFLSRIPGIDVIGAYVDGLTRGSTIAAISVPISPIGAPPSTTSTGRAILSAIATCGGGWIVHSFSLHQADWNLAIPPPLGSGAGLLGTMDIWVAMITSFVYSEVTVPTSTVGTYLGQATRSDHQTGKAVCATVMGSLLVARVITRSLLPDRTKVPKAISTPAAAATPVKESIEDLVQEIEKSGERSGTSTPRKRKGTPKKSPAPK